ncbi:lipase 1 precursor [Danaus plexippus plexippus]|uniref:Lipase 1 n=1 Tax=Danaus plexippus plexippus TaxID=278856 RepID=A0A212F3W7_DANPL|nr:lipase 1 precursor [Danaus plexippus plexippus]
MHGLLGSADDFVVAGVESGLAYQLSRGGYDVWLGNARGNKHSRRHTHLRPLDSKFWDFTWHEIGVYDLPAMIDYAFEKSGSTTLKYIGHSQGTTSFFVMASERPEYNAKISLMVALSPVAFMSHVRSPIIRLLASEGPLLYTISNGIGINEFLPDNKLVKTLKSLLCSVGVMSEILCNNLLFLIVGFDLEQLNVTNLPVLFGHVPSGSSAKQLAHYGQLIISDEFRKYDYGTHGNLRRYGKTFPPRYNLRRISAPVSLFYSDADWLAHPADVRRLLHELGNVVDVYKIPYKYFNHLDFLFSKDCKILIYERLRKVLQSF